MSSFYGVELKSRLLLGTSRYPSPAVLERAVKASGVEVVTVSLRRESGAGRAGQAFWSLIQSMGVRVLPNTAGCDSVKEEVTTAHMARELFDTPWIKLEVIGEADTLQPDGFGLVEAARIVPASVLGTVEYGALIWSFVFGYLFWAEIPAATVYVGAFLIVAAGLTLALSEHRSRREIMDAP